MSAIHCERSGVRVAGLSIRTVRISGNAFTIRVSLKQHEVRLVDIVVEALVHKPGETIGPSWALSIGAALAGLAAILLTVLLTETRFTAARLG